MGIKGVKETRSTWRYWGPYRFACFSICFPETPHSSWTNPNVAVNITVADTLIQGHDKGHVLVFFGYVTSHDLNSGTGGMAVARFAKLVSRYSGD